MKTTIDMIEGLRYKLRMMEIPLIGATAIFCDNQSVVENSTAPESVLKKRHNAIAYHRAREAQAAGIIKVAWEDGATNIADLLTKLMPGWTSPEGVGGLCAMVTQAVAIPPFMFIKYTASTSGLYDSEKALLFATI